MATRRSVRDSARMLPESKTILVIDDDPEARAALRALMTDAGFDVAEAADGEEAIHYLTSKRNDPVLIVTDLEMPDVSGWEFINVLQAYVRLSTMPVLVVSGKQLHERPVKEDGVLEFFPKPLDVERFLAAVERHAVTGMQREARRHAATKKLEYTPF